jgi:hypothetical protein
MTGPEAIADSFALEKTRPLCFSLPAAEGRLGGTVCGWHGGRQGAFEGSAPASRQESEGIEMTPFLRALMDAFIRINVAALAVGLALTLARMPILPHVTLHMDIPVPTRAGTEAGLVAPGDTRPIGRDASADLSPIPVAAG